MDWFADLRDLAREPGFDTRPLLSEMGGGGNGRRWDTEYFLSPLPPDGLMDVRCEWPGYIPETHATIDVTGPPAGCRGGRRALARGTRIAVRRSADHGRLYSEPREHAERGHCAR
jgi:hypothetical protein